MNNIWNPYIIPIYDISYIFMYSYTTRGFFVPPEIAQLILMIYGIYLMIEFIVFLVTFCISKKKENHKKVD